MAVTPNYGWPVPVATDYVKDGWEAISDLGNAIDTTVAGLGSGLSKVQSFTLTNSTGQVITGLTAGSRYKLLFNLYGSAQNIGVLLRFREGTTDKTTGYYGGSFGITYTGSYGNYISYNNSGSYTLTYLHDSADKQSVIDLDLFINTTQNQASLIGNSYIFYGGDAVFYGLSNDAMATCDGVNIYPASGNMTGKITIYKYED